MIISAVCCVVDVNLAGFALNSRIGRHVDGRVTIDDRRMRNANDEFTKKPTKPTKFTCDIGYRPVFRFGT